MFYIYIYYIILSFFKKKKKKKKKKKDFILLIIYNFYFILYLFFFYAIRNLYSFTEYNGMNGRMIGVLLLYALYFGLSP